MKPRIPIVGRLPVALSRRVRAVATRRRVRVNTVFSNALAHGRRDPAASRGVEGGPMTNPDLGRTLDAVGNRVAGGAGRTTARRRAVTAEAQQVIDCAGAGDREVRRLRSLQPTHPEAA